MSLATTIDPIPMNTSRFFNDSAAYAPWLVCFIASLFFFYEFIQMNMFNAISVDLMRQFHLSGGVLSSLSAAYFWADVALLFPAGILLDRFSTRKIILSAMGVCVVSTFCFSIAPTFSIAYMAHFAAGLGASFCLLSCLMLASRWFPPRRLAVVTGLIVTMGMAGGALSQTPMALLAIHLGWRGAVMVNSVIGLVFWVLMLIYIQERPSKPEKDYSRINKQPEQMPFKKGIVLAFSNLQNWYCGLYTSFLNMPLMVIGGLWGSIFLQQMHGMSMAQAATISSMLFVGTIFGSPAFGMLSDVLRSRKIPMLIGAVISLLSMLWLIYSPAFSFWGAMALFWFIGFITSAQIISYPAITESNPRSITGTALGLASALIMGGAGISQTIFGFLIDLRWDHVTESGIAVYSASNYHLAMMMFSVVLIIGLVLSLVVRETQCKNITES